MKHFILFLLLVFSSSNVDAQRATLFTNSGDTLTDAATSSLKLNINSGYQLATFQYVNKKVSGTIAGKAYLRASNDNVNWITLDSFTNTNIATNVKMFEHSPPKYLWYEVTHTGTGTMRCVPKVYAVLRRY